MASAQLLPSAEMAELSVRPYDPPERKFSYSFPPKHLLTLVIPDVYGNPATGLHGAFEREFAYDYNYGEYVCYVGIITLIMAMLAVVTLVREFIVRTFSILALLALVIAFGGYAGNGAPYQFIMMWFPGWEGFRVPARFLIFFHLSMSVLAAVGFNQAVYYLSERRRLRPSTLAPLCFLVLALVALDLNWFSKKQAFRFNATTEILADQGDVLTYLNSNPGEYRIFRLMGEVPYDLEQKNFRQNQVKKELGARLQIQRIQPNLHRLWNIQALRGYEEGLLPPLSYLTFIGQDVPRRLMGRFSRNLQHLPPDTLLLGLLNVKYILVDRPFAFPCPQLTPIKQYGYRPDQNKRLTDIEMSLRNEYGAYALYENQDYLPRFVWGKRLREVCHLESLDMLRLSESSLHSEPATTYNGDIAPVPNHPLGRKGMVSMDVEKPNLSYLRAHTLAEKDRSPQDNLWNYAGVNQSFIFSRPEGSPNSYELKKTSNQEGEILLLEAPFAGWVCRIGDETIPMRRVNSAMMGCDLPPEQEEIVTFSYEPFSFRIGLFISCCFAMLLASTVFLWRYPCNILNAPKGRLGRERPFTDPIHEA
jgi:hypothetical protein